MAKPEIKAIANCTLGKINFGKNKKRDNKQLQLATVQRWPQTVTYGNGWAAQLLRGSLADSLTLLPTPKRSEAVRTRSVEQCMNGGGRRQPQSLAHFGAHRQTHIRTHTLERWSSDGHEAHYSHQGARSLAHSLTQSLTHTV